MHRCNTRCRAIAPYDSCGACGLLPSVNAVGSGLSICVPGLIPGGAGLLDIMGAPLAATGRGWRHPTFTCRRSAPGRRARWLEAQGPVLTASGEAPVMVVEPRAAFSGSRLIAAVPGSDPSPQRWHRNSGVCARGLTPPKAKGPKNGPGQKTPPNAGAERQPVGRETAPEGLRALHGCRVRARVPVAPRGGSPRGKDCACQ